MVELALLDAQSELQDPEELLNGPALAVAADGRARVLGSSLSGAREQQPGGGLHPCSDKWVSAAGRRRLGAGPRPPSAAGSEMRKNEFMPPASPEGLEPETKS